MSIAGFSMGSGFESDSESERKILVSFGFLLVALEVLQTSLAEVVVGWRYMVVAAAIVVLWCSAAQLSFDF